MLMDVCFISSRGLDIPSGKHTKNYGKSPCYLWVNPLFLWPFSIAVLIILTQPEGISY